VTIVSVRVLFRCEFCGGEPDLETRKMLEEQLQELLFGQYLNAEPGHWLVWYGGGIYGPKSVCVPAASW